MSAAKKTKEDVWHTSVLFTGTIKLPNSAFHISKTTKLISTKFVYIFALYTHYFTLSKLKEITSVLLEIFVPKNCPIFFNFFFFFFACTKLQIIYLSHIKITFPCFDLFKIWNTYNAHSVLHFPKILRNFKKIEGAIYYNITFFAICCCC